jgi:hypothetical protein
MVDKPIVDEEDGFWMIAEGLKFTSMGPVYFDLYVTKFDYAGNVKWTSRIKKFTMILPEQYFIGSYKAHPLNGKLNLTYMDGSSDERDFVITTISPENDVHQEVFGNLKDYKTLLKVNSMGTFGNNSFFVYERGGYLNNKRKFIKIDFK